MVAGAVIGTTIIIVLITAVLGGIGLTSSLFKGLSNIPTLIWIAIATVIILYLLKGFGRK